MATTTKRPVGLSAPYEAFIWLEKRIYNPGELISGTLELDLKRKLCCVLITLKLYGSVRVFFTETSTDLTRLSRSTGYEQEKVLIDLKSEVWKTDQVKDPAKQLSIDEIVRLAASTSISPRRVRTDDYPGLEPGRHKFEFSFQLPDSGLETSFDASHSAGCIRYSIQMDATRDGFTALRKKIYFPIVQPKLIDNLKSDEWTSSLRQSVGGKGDVDVSMTLARVGFVPGEPVIGDITIKNGTSKSIKYSHLSLTQRAFCCSTYPEVKIKETTVQTAGMGLPIHKVPAGETYTYPISFYISALVPTFEIPSILSVDYYLKLDVGFERSGHAKSVIISMKAPIAIGTHSPSNSNDLDASSSSQQQPPKYSELPPSIDAPPPYSLCAGDTGLTSLTGADDADLDGYAPLYYQLNEDNVLRKRR